MRTFLGFGIACFFAAIIAAFAAEYSTSDPAREITLVAMLLLLVLFVLSMLIHFTLRLRRRKPSLKRSQ